MTEAVELQLSSREVVRGDFRPGTVAGASAVVYVHGFGSHRGGEKSAALAAACARRGWPFAAFDFRGHGSSDGTTRQLTAPRMLEDLAAVREFLAGRGHPRLALVGSSMGAFAAAWFAVNNPDAVAACVLLAPAFQFLERRYAELTESECANWKRTGVRRVRNEWVDLEIGYDLVAGRADFDPVELARTWRTPVLIFHGLGDTVVPAADSIAFIESTTFPDVELRLLKSGDHRLTAFKDEIAEEACRYFERVGPKRE